MTLSTVFVGGGRKKQAEQGSTPRALVIERVGTPVSSVCPPLLILSCLAFTESSPPYSQRHYFPSIYTTYANSLHATHSQNLLSLFIFYFFIIEDSVNTRLRAHMGIDVATPIYRS